MLRSVAWRFGQSGGNFSVSESNVESVTAYILNQAEHHKKFSYQEEIGEVFKRHRVAFDERYVWD
jgi:putative transposase